MVKDPEYFKRRLIRTVIHVDDVYRDKKQGKIVFEIRPSWSNIGPGEKTLPGGRMIVDDFGALAELARQGEVTQEQIVIAARSTALRILSHELGLHLSPSLLKLFSETTNEGWTTLAFGIEMEMKPQLKVNSDSDGTLWVYDEDLINGMPVFAEHGPIALSWLKMMGKY